MLILIIAANRFHAGPHLTRAASLPELFSHSITPRIENNSVQWSLSWQRRGTLEALHLFQAISRSVLKGTPVMKGAMNTFSGDPLPNALQKGVVSDSSSSTRSPSIFQGGETGTVLSVCIISASHPSAGCCSQTASQRPLRACEHFPFHLCAPRGNLPLIVSHFPRASQRHDADGGR